MKLIYEGAEAKLFESEFLGKKSIEKQRIEKKYRRKELDEKIRKERTKQEALLMHKAKMLGIRAPVIYEIDLNEKKIIMEKIEGIQLKKAVSKNLFLLEELGKIIGLLHKNNIIHGDLTTSNIIVKAKRLALVDFGLGYHSASFEDKAVDLIAFKKTFTATHTKHIKHWNKILKAYEKQTGYAGIGQKIREIEARARYS